MIEEKDIFFEVVTPLDFKVRVTNEYWQLITTKKHRILIGKEKEIINALEQPDQIRRSRSDRNVYLFYQVSSLNKWLCSVVKRLNGNGFLITAYITNAIKKGDIIWSK